MSPRLAAIRDLVDAARAGIATFQAIRSRSRLVEPALDERVRLLEMRLAGFEELVDEHDHRLMLLETEPVPEQGWRELTA